MGIGSGTARTPGLFTIDLACRFLVIAEEIKCLDEPECERLDENAAGPQDHRQGGLTDKNIALLRQVLTPGSGAGWSSRP